MGLLFLLVTLGALITSLTGLGGGTLILAGMLLVYPPELAIPLHSFTQVTANAIRTGIYFKLVNWRIVFTYAALMLPGAWIGAEIFEHINPSFLKILVGSLILISVLPFKFRPQGEPSARTFVILGALSGFLGIFVGAVGPMVTPFFNRLKMPREGSLSTKSAGQMLLQLSKIIAFSGAASLDLMSLRNYIAILMVASFLGVIVSIPIGKKISDKKFDQIVNILLGLISVKILAEGISEIFLPSVK